MISYKDNRMLVQAREAQFKPGLFLQILLFIAVYLVGTSVSAIPVLIAVYSDPLVVESLVSGDVIAFTSAVVSVSEKPLVIVINLFATGLTTLICILYCCIVKHIRSPYNNLCINIRILR